MSEQCCSIRVGMELPESNNTTKKYQIFQIGAVFNLSGIVFNF